MSGIGNVVIIMLLLTFLLSACNTLYPETEKSPLPALETKPENIAVIRDRTGRLWDVTHARDVYGMNPDFFNYGLGIDAIPSVDNTVVLDEGDPGYPGPDSRIEVFGIDHNGEQRAYGVSALTRHEVFNETFPGESDQYLAIAY
jgi:hypothetical protein